MEDISAGENADIFNNFSNTYLRILYSNFSLKGVHFQILYEGKANTRNQDFMH
jgi:hypothetical protein